MKYNTCSVKHKHAFRFKKIQIELKHIFNKLAPTEVGQKILHNKLNLIYLNKEKQDEHDQKVTFYL